MTVQCSWCGKVLISGAWLWAHDLIRLAREKHEPISHGICPSCVKSKFPELEEEE